MERKVKYEQKLVNSSVDNKVQQKKFLLYEEKQGKINLNLKLKLNKKKSLFKLL